MTNNEPPAPEERPKTFADLKKEIGPITFDWRPYLAKGFLTIVSSETGMGKSNLLMRLCGCYLLGLDWPDGTKFTGETGAVVWCEAESAQALNLERAERWNYPIDRIYFPLGTLDDVVFDNPKFREAITKKAHLPEVRFIVYDSLSGSTRRNEKDSEIKGVPQFLAMLARDVQKPIALSHHLRKKTMFDPEEIQIDRLRGFSGIAQYARIILAMDAPDNNNSDRKRVSMIKNNLCKLAKPIGMTISDDGISFGIAPEKPKVETQNTRAVDLLLSLLAKEPVRETKVEEEFRGACISTATMRRAQKDLQIVSFRKADGWYWSLPYKDDENI